MTDIVSFLPEFSLEAAGLFATWLVLQLVLAVLPDGLHRILPAYQGGNIQGAVTPAGNRLWYKINGLQAWVISHLVFIIGAWIGLFSPTIIFDQWGTLLWVVNGLGFLLAFFVFIKAYFFPSFPKDRKFSSHLIYDFCMGIELNPRIGPIDLKLFFNGRPGIVAWTLINLSFASVQYTQLGYVTNSMLLVNLFHALYVLYFFWKEAWYLKTIDIHHDHFGWMLAWGDCVWLPYMYTLQGLFLVFHPVQLSSLYALFVLGLGLLGFWIFASANNQKDKFRKLETKATIWGAPPKMITCHYTTQDGSTRESRLLLSGWWGLARHMNYTGDLILSCAYSLACGTSYLFPWFYFAFLSILLIHRCLRDEDRCQKKYGQQWQEYCNLVPYRLIPKIW
jgi:7-dehydrocholesterol reductase